MANYDMFAILGQSNAFSSWGGADPNLDVAGANFDHYTQAGAVVAASEPLDYPGGQYGQAFPWPIGFPIAFSRPYSTHALAAGRRGLLVPCAQGGTGYSNGYWNPGNAYYESVITRMNAAMALAGSHVLKAIWWQGGEADFFGPGATNYVSTFSAMCSDFRSRVTGAANTPVFAGYWSPWQDADRGAAFGSYGPDLPAAVAAVPHCYIVSSTVPCWLTTDNPEHYGTSNFVHFDAPSQRALGARYYDVGATNGYWPARARGGAR